jgi:hypothetical protein
MPNQQQGSHTPPKTAPPAETKLDTRQNQGDGTRGSDHPAQQK